ncbi:MAG: hypothetical protein V4590_06595 [Bacteroidota bacterium]
MKTTFQQKISNVLFVFTLLSTFVLLTYCTNQGKEKTRESLTEFKAYVKEHKDATANYVDQKWEDLEKEYNQKKAELDKDLDKMDQEMKDSYRAAEADWEAFKTEYLLKQKEKEEQAKAEQFKATILPPEISTDFSNINGKNIAPVLEHFVNTVDNKKETYSKEEWININNYWKSLNDLAGRLDENHQVTREDSRKMDGLRIKYMAIKALNKPFAESEHNK